MGKGLVFCLYGPFNLYFCSDFLPRSAPRGGPGRCCLPAAAAGNGGRSGTAAGRACRPYVRPLCNPARRPRARRSPCCTAPLGMESPQTWPSRPVPGGTQGGKGARGEAAPSLARREESPGLWKGLSRLLLLSCE